MITMMILWSIVRSPLFGGTTTWNRLELCLVFLDIHKGIQPRFGV